MNLIVLLLILLALGCFGGGYAGFYPTHYGYGGGGLVIIILLVLAFTGRL